MSSRMRGLPIGSEHTLIHFDSILANPEIVEKEYNASYVGEFCLRTKDGSWLNNPAAVFYTEKPHPEGSNYFALYYMYGFDPEDRPKLMITNGITAVENTDGTPVVYLGITDEATGEILYSAFRHDYQEYKSLVADGGREYFNGSIGPLMRFKITKTKPFIELMGYL